MMKVVGVLCLCVVLSGCDVRVGPPVEQERDRDSIVDSLIDYEHRIKALEASRMR